MRPPHLISDNSFPICIGWKCGVVKPSFNVLKQIVSHQHLTNTQHDTDKCCSRVKVALSSTFEQISDSWSHIGLSDKTPKKEQHFNGNFRSNIAQPRHLKADQNQSWVHERYVLKTKIDSVQVLVIVPE